MAGIPIRAVGFAWFRREDYDEIRRLFVDGDKLPATYDAWLSKAEHGFQQITSQGHLAEKVYIDPREFAGWCAVRGMDINANARVRFASEFVARKYHNQS